MAQNFNIEPYNDDYNEDKKFYKILFRPAYNVQARELNQLQTIIQKQIERFGSSIYKNGSIVTGGRIRFDNAIKYVTLESNFGSSKSVSVSSYIKEFVGKTIVGETSGVRAEILQATPKDATSNPMLFVKYVGGGQDTSNDVGDGEQGTFIAGEIITTVEDNSLDEISAKIVSTNAFGEASGASIDRGVFYINGYFVMCDKETIILSKTSKKPTFKVGLKISESVIDATDDPSLLDNAIETTNAYAEGANRYFIDLFLEKRTISSNETNDFIEMMRVESGNVTKINDKSQYSDLGDTLARRTYDESGHYTVKPFSIDVREFRSNDRKVLTAGIPYIQGDVIKYNNVYYVAQNNGVSTSTIPTNDNGVIWVADNSPNFNRGVNEQGEKITIPLKDAGGNVVYNEDGSPVLTTRPITLAENIEDDNKIAVGVSAGKAYVYGYEIEKIATSYVPVSKSRDFEKVEDNLFSADYGNYILVDNMNAVPNVSDLPKVELYDKYTTTKGLKSSGNLVGTARVRAIQYHSGTGNNTIYKLFLFDIAMKSDKSFNERVKQVYIQGATQEKTFTGDATIIPTLLSGSLVFDTPTTTNTIIGQNTKFLTEISVGDYIFIDDSPRLVTSIQDNITLTISSSVTSQKGSPVVLCKSLLNEPTNKSLIFPLPQSTIKEVSNLSYFINQSFRGIQSSSANVLTINTSGGSEFSNPNNISNYLIVNQNTGAVVYPISASRSGDNQSISFNLPSGNANTLFDVIATVQKDALVGKKTKTIKTKTVILDNMVNVVAKKIYLGEADAIKLKSVKMRSGQTEGSGDYTVDITSRFTLYSGQTESYYGVSFISVKNGQALPSNGIKIEFDYYEHSSGDYFCANSYPNYKTIGSFGGMSLRDFIDFRPRVDSSLTGEVVFSGNNDFIPKYGEDLLVDYSYYIGKIAKIALNKNGDLVVNYGAPSKTPREPADSPDAMTLFKLDIQPYTFDTSTKQVGVTVVDNKRYTMRDIGKLEKRIDTLEYYTTLSLLEQDTQSMSVIDNNGLDRFKNGFVVDNFKSQAVGDVTSADYMCSLDMNEGILRPFYAMDSIEMIDTFSKNSERITKGYQSTGDVITLPYTETVLVEQPRASSSINVNPFAVFTFFGDLSVTPAIDKWFDTEYRPDVIINKEGNYAAIEALANRTGALGTVWNAWQTQWTGVSSNSFVSGAWSTTSVSQTRVTGGLTTNTTTTNFTNITTNTTTTSEQVRSGVNTSLQSVIENRTVDDRVVSTAVIPYCRSRNILVQASGLIPNTRFYPFFDDVNMSSYITTASKITITSINNVDFDTSTNIGSDFKDDARSFANDEPDIALNIGDVINGSLSKTTAIVVGYEETPTGTKNIYVVNIKSPSESTTDTFTIDETITGSITGATAKVLSVTLGEKSGNIISNSNGECQFIIDLPNDSKVRFRTGTHTISLLDIPTLSLSDSESWAQGEYVAEGYLQTREQVVEAVRNAMVVQTAVSDSRVISNTSSSTQTVSTSSTVSTRIPTRGGGGGRDPVAQTFFVGAYDMTGSNSTKSSDCFITSVDVYFESKDDSVPITLEIRPVVNGYPSSTTVLPFGRVTLNPTKVKLSADSTVATKFTFPSPVFVKAGMEYSVVLLANSVKYKVWISVLGEKDKILKTFIDKQPSLGSLFVSQNSFTWTAEQTKDLKMVVNRAKFKSGTIGSVEFVNRDVTPKNIQNNSLEFAKGSKFMRIYADNHGLTVGSKVNIKTKNRNVNGTISVANGALTVSGTDTTFNSDMMVGTSIYRLDGAYIGEVLSIQSNTLLTLKATSKTTYSGDFLIASPMFGIDAKDIFKTHIVNSVDGFDSFTVVLATPSNTSGFGGTDISISRAIQYDVFQPTVVTQTPVGTSINGYFSGVSGKSVGGTQLPYLTATELGKTKWTNITLNENNFCPYTYMIASPENELARPSDNDKLNLSSNQSLANSSILKLDLYSQTDTLSPVIDGRGVNLILINNKIDMPTKSINTELDVREIVSTGSSVNFDGKFIKVADLLDDRAMVKSLFAGQYITVSNTLSNNGEYLITNVASDGSFIEVDKELVSESATDVKIISHDKFFSEIVPVGSSSYSKYVTRDINLQNPSNFIKLRFSAFVPTLSHIGVFVKIKPVGSEESFDDIEYKEIDTKNLYTKSLDGVFRDVQVDIGDLGEFNSCKFKFVFNSTDTTRCPEIKDLRVIICA